MAASQTPTTIPAIHLSATDPIVYGPIELRVRELVATRGRDRRCRGCCIVHGRKCPSGWCEIYYYEVKKGLAP